MNKPEEKKDKHLAEKLEKELEGILQDKLKDGTIEKVVAEQFEKSLSSAINDLFKSYGDVTKIVKEQLKSIIVPYIESYDFSTYTVKLDSVLQEVLDETTMEHRNLLGNFNACQDSICFN